jgi:predicted lipase
MTKIISLTASLLLLAFFSAISSAEQAKAPDFVELQSFARLANASYANEAAIKKELANQHYELEKLIAVPGYLVAGFVASSEATKTQVIVVLGTANEENAFVYIALQLLPDKKTGAKLHQGFSQSASNFYQQVLPLLRRDYRIITVGHSLGGAVANILAMYLDEDKYQIEKVITFGQPKVTNVSGARKYAHLAVTRVVTPKDVVPLVPPLDPMDLMKLDIYWHMGKEIVLLDNHEYAVLEGVKSMLRISRFTDVVPDESNLQHHMMAEYLRRIADNIPDAKQVPYDTGFNLFGAP